MQHRAAVAKLRLSSHPLNIEALRGTIQDPNHRLCQACTESVTENELHFMITCELYNTERDAMWEILSNNQHINTLTPEQILTWLLS